MSGADEIFGLAREFSVASTEIAKALYDTYAQEGETFAKDWAANARQPSGVHGKYYPDSIDSETRVALGISVEIGPNAAKKQGVMGRGFELGSQNQPPHLDGTRALPIAAQRLERAADTTIAYLLP